MHNYVGNLKAKYVSLATNLLLCARKSRKKKKNKKSIKFSLNDVGGSPQKVTQ